MAFAYFKVTGTPGEFSQTSAVEKVLCNVIAEGGVFFIPFDPSGYIMLIRLPTSAFPHYFAIFFI